MVAALIGFAALLPALFTSFFRAVFYWLIVTAATIPCKDEKGRDCLVYFGDVPPLAWLYSAWPRVISFVLELVTAAVGAFFASAALFAATSLNPAAIFAILFAAVWIIPHGMVIMIFRWESRHSER